jgi:hypothetical protein
MDATDRSGIVRPATIRLREDLGLCRRFDVLPSFRQCEPVATRCAAEHGDEFGGASCASMKNRWKNEISRDSAVRVRVFQRRGRV